MNNYDSDNVFAKIIRNEIPCKKIYEDGDMLCFEDIAHAAPVHLLLIPKQHFTCYEDFIQNAQPDYIVKFFKILAKITEDLGINKTGYRLITNNGSNVGQSIFHFHVHILAGKKMTELVS